MPFRTLCTLCITLVLVACGGSADPRLAMCQAVAKQLTGNAIASWERIERIMGGRWHHVQIDYGTTGGGSGSIDCAYPVDDGGSVATAPDRVKLDGATVERHVLLRAGVNATKELIAGTAAETVKRTRDLTSDATQKARELAGQAVDSALEAGKSLQDKSAP